jgi:hypothetical protein
VEIGNDTKRTTILLVAGDLLFGDSLRQFIETRDFVQREGGRYRKSYRFILVSMKDRDRSLAGMMPGPDMAVAGNEHFSDLALFRSFQTTIEPALYIISPSGETLARSSGFVSASQLKIFFGSPTRPVPGKTPAFGAFAEAVISGAYDGESALPPDEIRAVPADLIANWRALGKRSGQEFREYGAYLLLDRIGPSSSVRQTPPIASGRTMTETILRAGDLGSSYAGMFADFHTHPGDVFFSAGDIVGTTEHGDVRIMARPDGEVVLALPMHFNNLSRGWAENSPILYSDPARYECMNSSADPTEIVAKTLNVSLYKLAGDRFVRLPPVDGTLDLGRMATELNLRLRARISEAMYAGQNVTAERLRQPSRMFEVSRDRLDPKQLQDLAMALIYLGAMTGFDSPFALQQPDRHRAAALDLKPSAVAYFATLKAEIDRSRCAASRFTVSIFPKNPDGYLDGQELFERSTREVPIAKYTIELDGTVVGRP